MAREERPSVCTFDCPDTCSLTVTVEDERIVKVRGSHALPFTDGVICNKVAQDMAAFVHGPQRLLHPLRRTGPKGSGKFERISWDAALDEIHERVQAVIDRWGPQAVTPLNYAGPHGLLADDSMSMRFFHRLGASQVYRRSLCGGVRTEAWAGTYGAAPGCPPEFAEHADLNVVWGNNATVANLHLVRCIRRARCAKAAGWWWSIRCARRSPSRRICIVALLPGTDALLAWSLAAELERTGAFDHDFIAAHVLGFERIHGAARANGRRRGPPRPAACRRQQILTLAQLAGGGRAAGAGPRQRAGAWAQRRQRHPRRDRAAGAARQAGQGQRHRAGRRQRLSQDDGEAAAAGPRAAGTRTLNLIEIGRHLETDDLDPPLRAVFIYNHNPIVVHPEQNRMRRGLAREDIFSVGIEVAMTESMAHCDIVLPAATHFECDDLYAVLRPSMVAAGRAGDRAAGRIAAEHRDLPPSGGALRLRRSLLHGDRRRLMDEAIDPADRRLGGVRPSRIPTDSGVQMAGAGRQADGAVRQRPPCHAVRKDRAEVRHAGASAGVRRRACRTGARGVSTIR